MSDIPELPRPPMTARLVEGPPGPTLFRMAVPMFWGMLAVTTFNMVDTFYIGRLGTAPLAAMGFTFPVVFVIQCVLMGMSVGTSAILSRAIGEGDPARVRRLATDSLLLSVILVAALAAVGGMVVDPVFRLLGATPDIITLIRPYIQVWFAGVWLLVIPMVGNSIIRATGDAFTPSMIMITAGVANIILDPLLIFGIGPFPRLGLRGAAIASVLSWALACGVGGWMLTRRLHLLDLSWPRPALVLQSWRRLASLGFPAVATNLLMPISAGVLTRLVASYGPEAVAAFGVGTRLETLAMSGGFALSTVLAPFIGQNYGAGRLERVREGLGVAMRYALWWGGAVCLLFAVCARPLAGLFSVNPEVVRLTALYLWIIPVTYGMYGISAQVTALFNATHHPLRSASIFVLRLFVFWVPLAHLGAWSAGLPGVFAGLALGNVLTALVALGMQRRFLRSAGAS